MHSLGRKKIGSEFAMNEKPLKKNKERTERKRVVSARRPAQSRKVQVDEMFQNPAEITRLMLENANDAIYVVQDGLLKFANVKTLDIFQRPRKALVSKPFIAHVHANDREVIRERHKRRLRGEEIPNMFPFRIIDGRGCTRWIEVNNVLISWQGQPAASGLTWTCRR